MSDSPPNNSWPDDRLDALIRQYMRAYPWEVNPSVWDALAKAHITDSSREAESVRTPAQAMDSPLDRITGAVFKWILSVREMVEVPQPALLAGSSTEAQVATRFAQPPTDVAAGAWLDRIELIRRIADGEVRYRARAVARPNANAPRTSLRVAVVAPNGTRSEVLLENDTPKSFVDPPAGGWDELQLEITTPEPH